MHKRLIMKILRILLVSSVALAFMLAAPAPGAEKAVKLTCCQEANAKGEECKHKCCVSAHKEGKSCEKCNPNKEDLKLLKKKADKKADK